MNHVTRGAKHGASFIGTRLTPSSAAAAVAVVCLDGHSVVLVSLLLSSLVGLCVCISLPATVYLPKGMEGRIRCPEEANPPLTFIIWKKNDRVIDGQQKRVSIDEDGTLVVDFVVASDEGNYTCTPYSPLSDIFSSFLVRIIVKDVPSFSVRPLSVYQRLMDEAVTMHCVADGDPKPHVSWKKADGPFPPTTRTLHDGGNLTIARLGPEDDGSYECIAQNIVTTIITTTLLRVRANGNGSPHNVSVEVSDTTARISWLPPYIGADHLQEFKCELWCQSESSGADSWQRFDAIPDNVNTVTVYNLQPKTQYRFKMMSNYSGRPHFSREVVVMTKYSDILPFEVTSRDDDEWTNSGDYSGVSSSLPSTTIGPLFPSSRPAAPVDVAVQQLQKGINVSWSPAKHSPVPIEYFLVQYRNMTGRWTSLSGKIDGGQTHYMGVMPSPGLTYQFRVMSFGRGLLSNPGVTVTFVKTDVDRNPGVSAPGAANVGGVVAGVVSVVLLVVLLAVAFRTYRIKWRKKNRETVLSTTEYANTSIHRTLEGRASPILETLSIISNHSQIQNNDHEMRPCHETPI